jgi:hypothetical protein
VSEAAGSREVRLGDPDAAHLQIEIDGYEHPEVAEPQGFDVLACRVLASAAPVRATFRYGVRGIEFEDLSAYLVEINSGNGPPKTLEFADGLFALSFAPSRRGPVLCAVTLKTIEESHLRLEFMIALEPSDISTTLHHLSNL